MPSQPDFEYTYRWSEIVANGVLNSAHILQDRDYALETKLRENCPSGAATYTALKWNDDTIVDGVFAQYEATEAMTIPADTEGIQVTSISGTGTFRFDVYINELIVHTADVDGTGFYGPSSSISYVAGDFFRVEFSLVDPGITSAVIDFYFGPVGSTFTFTNLTPVYP